MTDQDIDELIEFCEQKADDPDPRTEAEGWFWGGLSIAIEKYGVKDINGIIRNAAEWTELKLGQLISRGEFSYSSYDYKNRKQEDYERLDEEIANLKIDLKKELIAEVKKHETQHASL